MHQNGYINTTIDPRETDVDKTVEYEECGENGKNSIYEQLSTDRDSSNHDYIVLTLNLEAGSKQLDNQVHQKKQAQMRQLFFILFCITITASVTAVATFFPTKQLMERNSKYTTPCITTCNNDTKVEQQNYKAAICRHNDTNDNQPCSREAGSCTVPCLTEPCENGGTYMNDICLCNDGFAGSKCEIGDYLADGYVCYVACRACIAVTPSCVGFSDGIYRNKHIPDQYEVYFECRDERNIYVGENPCQSNKAPYNGKCQDLFQIPPSSYQVGYGIDCSGRPNGNYKNDKGRCDIYYTCVNGNSTLTHCIPGKNFDLKTSFCQNPDNACTPCGSVSDGC